MSKKKVIEWILFVAWCGFILWMTLLSRKPLTNRIFRPNLFYEFRKILMGEDNGVSVSILFFENILLFIPFGFLLPWKKNWKQILFISFLTSVLIEFIQFLTMLGECETDDVIANVLGALVGYGFYLIINRFVKRGES